MVLASGLVAMVYQRRSRHPPVNVAPTTARRAGDFAISKTSSPLQQLEK
jgi:hypothetical protein